MDFEELPKDPSLADPIPASPFTILACWLDEAREGRVQRNPGAMGVATVGPDGSPSLRIVLCRGFDPDAGSVTFYTNRRSRKGQELAAQPRAAATFHWDALQRQARLEGVVAPVPEAESDAYFAGRPRPAQIAAWASDQSEPLASRQALLAKIREAEARFAGQPSVPRPPHWGGYRLLADRVELWVGSEARAHDRAEWTRQPGGEWSAVRLQP